MAQIVKNLTAMQKTWVWFPGGEDPLVREFQGQRIPRTVPRSLVAYSLWDPKSEHTHNTCYIVPVNILYWGGHFFFFNSWLLKYVLLSRDVGWFMMNIFWATEIIAPFHMQWIILIFLFETGINSTWPCCYYIMHCCGTC